MHAEEEVMLTREAKPVQVLKLWNSLQTGNPSHWACSKSNPLTHEVRWMLSLNKFLPRKGSWE